MPQLPVSESRSFGQCSVVRAAASLGLAVRSSGSSKPATEPTICFVKECRATRSPQRNRDTLESAGSGCLILICQLHGPISLFSVKDLSPMLHHYIKRFILFWPLFNSILITLRFGHPLPENSVGKRNRRHLPSFLPSILPGLGRRLFSASFVVLA